MPVYSVPLQQFVDQMGLHVAYAPEDMDKRVIVSAEVNRPAFVLQGFFEHFDAKRIQICGLAEYSYLDSLTAEKRAIAQNHLFSRKPVAVVITRAIEVTEDVMELARKYSVPLLACTEATSHFMSEAISYLAVELAPRVFRHGVLVEVYGEGVLLLGESGVGKSETAIELVKRGHRLIADDSVELRRVSDHTIVGTAPENIRHFIEIRGIGIVNVRQLFGMGAVKMTERVDIIIELEPANPDKNYSVIEPNQEKMDLLGVMIPKLTVPVRPGRNLAVIIEVAAMNNRQIKMGYNPVDELFKNLKDQT